MMYILEAPPNDEHNNGLYFPGSTQEIKQITQFLLIGALGALAAEGSDLPDALTEYAIRVLSDDKPSGGVPRRFVPAVGAILGGDDENFLRRQRTLIDSAAAGSLTVPQLLEETRIIRSFTTDQEPPQWLTHEGVHATYTDGRITPRVTLIDQHPSTSPGNYEEQIAREVGANSYADQAEIQPFMPGSDAPGPVVLSDGHTLLGRMTDTGNFEPLVTVPYRRT